LTVIKLNNYVYVFLCMVLLAVRMVADVTETRNVISEFGIQNLYDH